ncbi:MAG: c-type cytochrome [Pirellulaceae bacterium]|nr:c-type cytochrome [Pirellulaceae bacterium]
MKRSIVYLFTFLLVCYPHIAKAIDESESLAMLVETLDAADDPSVRSALMRGMLSGLAGRRNVAAPKGWSELSEKLATSKDEGVRNLSLQLSQTFGDVKAMRRALAILQDTSADSDTRRTALRSLLTQQNEEVSSLLESLLDETPLRLAAIRGYAMVENASAPSVLLGRYAQMSPELRRAVLETLATRKRYAQALLAAVRQGTVSRDEIPAHVARSLNNILGDRFARVYGKVRPVAEDREKLMAKYKKMITPSAIAGADASRGRAVFKKTCAACHVLYGEGGKIGPELTGSNRANLDYILLNSVDPSYDVPDGYKLVLISTVDGRVINGVVAEEDGTRVVLKTVEQPTVVIAKEDIETRRVSPKSMMPDGQLEQMKPQEVIDLIKYLRTTEQVEMAK